jgi:hypothetical protein
MLIRYEIARYNASKSVITRKARSISCWLITELNSILYNLLYNSWDS